MSIIFKYSDFFLASIAINYFLFKCMVHYKQLFETEHLTLFFFMLIKWPLLNTIL